MRPKNSLGKNRGARRGAALITALSMLLLLSMLGTAYVGYMSMEQDDSRMSVQSTRARYLAEGGLYAAIGEIQTAIRAGRVPESEHTIELPVYMMQRGELITETQSVTVQITDESARANVNHVDRAVLEALGVPRDAARDIRAVFSGTGADGGTTPTAWFASVQDLRTRGFLTGPEFVRAQQDSMTVYTAADPDNPRNYININSAPAGVLTALFNLTADEALSLVQKRPFSSWDDVVRKIGKDPATFNVIANAEPNRAMPVELALSSRCFRLVSTTKMINAFTSRKGLTKGVEAVVLLSDDGNSYEFRFWSETPVELTEIVMAEGTGEEEGQVPPAGAGEAPEEATSTSEGAKAEGAPAEGETAGPAPSEQNATSAQAVQ